MNRASILFFCVLAVFLTGVYYFRTSPSERIVESLLAQNLLCDPPDGFFDDLEVLSRGTTFQNRWQVNHSPKSNYINIFITCRGVDRPEPTLSQDTRRVIGNCAYIGVPNAIVCSRKFLDDFVVQHGVIDGGLGWSYSSRDEVMRHARRSLSLWVMGHELGHILNSHKPSHFGPSDFEKMVSSSSLDHHLEYQADEFVVKLLSNHREKLDTLEILLVNLLFAEVRSKVGTANIYPGTGVPITSGWIEYARSGSHPEFVIRATRLLSLLYAVDGHQGFKKQIDDFAKALREAKSTKK